MSETLTVIDNRTGKTITVPIKENAIPATAFKQLVLNDPEGIKVYDPSYQNTAVTRSSITFIDVLSTLSINMFRAIRAS